MLTMNIRNDYFNGLKYGLCRFCALQPLQTPPYYALSYFYNYNMFPFLLRLDSKELISVAKT